MTKRLPKPRKVPCASCPYRKDVPSGIWAASEYEKLPAYDGPTYAQSPLPFFCHQMTGELCAGWVGCHGPRELLALRGIVPVDPSTFDYVSPVELFASGEEAMKHGLKDLEEPGPTAIRMAEKLRKKQRRDAR